MFVDECVIKVQAGDGGRGCIAFRREKYEPWGGPCGGDGGKGGDIVLVGDENTNNLIDYKYKPHWKAQRGEHGLGKDCDGRAGKDCEMRMPLGTVVINVETGIVVAELTKKDERIVLCKGGNGGFGNLHFKSSINRAPRQANPGQEGETGTYRLILKSIADVGCVGFPNAGKSSLTNAITHAHPKMASYPFTTLHPQIGVIDFPETNQYLLLADVPGLIEGASENKGLGHRFLRHIERCAVLVFIIDMAAVDGRDPREDYATLVGELKKYDKALLKKPRVVVANKMDLPEAKANLVKFRKKHKVVVAQISCTAKTGLDKLKKSLLKKVIALRGEEHVAVKR